MKSIVTLSICLLLLTVGLGAPKALAVNKALSLDGEGDYVEIPDSDSLFTNNKFTVEAWFNIHRIESRRWNQVFANDEYEIAVDGNNNTIVVWDNGADFGTLGFNGSTTILTNTWYHVAFINDGTTRQILLNGHPDAKSTKSIPLFNETQELWIGNDPSPPSRHFDGLIDEVRIWNIARTQEEIRLDINQPIENPELLENLVGYWNFDGGTAEDLSQYGNDGTLQGDATIVEAERAKVIFVPDDYLTIQEAIDAANPGDTVVVDPGTYPENIIISKNGITLQGSGADVTIIDGGGSGSVIKMSGISDVIISEFTITNGLGDGQDYQGSDNGGGIAIYECSNITIQNNVITQNHVTGGLADGGGILISKCVAPITIAFNTITDNHADNWGGGICIQGTFDVLIKHSDISNNDAGVGDGISLWAADVGASARIVANRIADNQGDGIYVSDGCSALIGGNLDGANDIFGNTEYAVRNDSTNPIDATYNYWGTTAEVEIQDAIWDYYDDQSKGVVNYEPWTNEAHTRVFPFAQALNLDGDGDYVLIGKRDTFKITTLTVETWFNVSAYGSTILWNGDTTGGWDPFWLHISDDGKLQLRLCILGGDVYLQSKIKIKLQNWCHVAFVIDDISKVATLYLDGVLEDSAVFTGSSVAEYNHLAFGAYADGGGTDSFTTGLIDEVRIWNVALTQEEIRATMNTTLKGDEPGLVGYWNFDDGTADDSSPYGNHGTLMGDAEIIPLVGTWPPPLRGDVSGNGTVSAYDASLILQYVVGLIDEFPADRMSSPSAIEPKDYEVSLPNVEAHAGGKIQVPIAINDATGLLAGGITIKYDQTVLRAVDYASLKLLNGYYWKANTNLPGEVRFAFATTEVVTTMGQGNLLMVEFEVFPHAEGKISPLIIENVSLSNSRSITKINGEVRVIPSSFALLQNFPNPFNPDTWLPYKLASASTVSISIYNAKGQLIRTLHLGYQNAGVYVTRGKAAYWDGKDNVGEKVSSGVYFYNLQAGEFRSTRKMVIMK